MDEQMTTLPGFRSRVMQGVILNDVSGDVTPDLVRSGCAVQVAAIGGGVYGVYQSAENGYVGSAVVGSLAVLLAAYGLKESFAQGGSGTASGVSQGEQLDKTHHGDQFIPYP